MSPFFIILNLITNPAHWRVALELPNWISAEG